MCADQPGRDGLTIGERIEFRRRRRGLSRRALAQLVGRSEEWLRLVESGRLRLENVYVIEQLADILHIDDLTYLIDRPWARRNPSWTMASDAVLMPLQQAIIDHPLMRAFGAALWTDDPDPETVQHDLHRCHRIWTTSTRRYSLLAARLPVTLAAARLLHERSETADRLLVYAYHLAAAALLRTGATGAAWTACDRAMETAARSGEWPLVAASAWYIADCLLRQQCPDECRDYALSAARTLCGEQPDTEEKALFWGSFQLLAARAAALARDITEFHRLAASAQHVADDAAAVVVHRSTVTFGAVEVGLTRIEVAVEQENFEDAIALAEDLEVTDTLPVDHRVRYHLALAYAFVRCRDDIAAVFVLAKVADACVEDLRFAHHAHRTIQLLMRRNNRLVRQEVARMAALAGLG